MKQYICRAKIYEECFNGGNKSRCLLHLDATQWHKKMQMLHQTTRIIIFDTKYIKFLLFHSKAWINKRMSIFLNQTLFNQNLKINTSKFFITESLHTYGVFNLVKTSIAWQFAHFDTLLLTTYKRLIYTSHI